MIGFSFIVKFYFGVMKFDVDEAGLNLKNRASFTEAV